MFIALLITDFKFKTLQLLTLTSIMQSCSRERKIIKLLTMGDYTFSLRTELYQYMQ